MDKSNSVCETNAVVTNWNGLGSDLMEMILSRLPVSSIVRAACVCKSWRSFITSSSLVSRVCATNKPWLFLCGSDNTFPEENLNQAFAFDPDAMEWINMTPPICPFKGSFVGSDSFLINITPTRFSFKSILNGSWRHISPLRYSRSHALIGAYNEGSEIPRFIVVGGVLDSGALVLWYTMDHLPVEIYNPDTNIWEIYPPLPAEFSRGNSSQWMSSALLRGKLYVYGICSRFVSYFDLKKRSWSAVQTLRPPEALYSFLISCQDMLILAGMCNSSRKTSFTLWKIDEKSMEFSELSIMPQDLLNYVFDSDGDDEKFVILKCVGVGSLIYVINEERHLNHPACVCEVNSQPGKCRWSKVPCLPQPLNKSRKVVSFCSHVSLENAFFASANHN